MESSSDMKKPSRPAGAGGVAGAGIGLVGGVADTESTAPRGFCALNLLSGGKTGLATGGGRGALRRRFGGHNLIFICRRLPYWQLLPPFSRGRRRTVLHKVCDWGRSVRHVLVWLLDLSWSIGSRWRRTRDTRRQVHHITVLRDSGHARGRRDGDLGRTRGRSRILCHLSVLASCWVDGCAGANNLTARVAKEATEIIWCLSRSDETEGRTTHGGVDWTGRAGADHRS